LILASEVKKFIHAERDDWRWVKEESREKLLWALEGIDPRPDVSDLMHHQLAMLLMGIACQQFAFWAGMGVGKTLVNERLIKFWREAGIARKALIAVPSIEAVVSWEDELEKWKHPYPFLGLDNDTSAGKAEKWLSFEEGAMIVAYPSLNRMVTAAEPILDKNKRPTGKTRFAPNRASLDILCKGLGSVHWDESTELKTAEGKHHGSLSFRVARAISNQVDLRYALAGRPFGKDPADLWGQQYLVDHGASLGPTLGLFRAAFFEEKKRYFGGPFSKDYKLRKDQLPEIYRCSSHRSIRYATEECVDLPPLHRIKKEIDFPEETLAYYHKIVEHMIAAKGDKKVINNDFLRLRQLSSGFLGFANDEAGVRAEITFDDNPKLELLIELLKQMPYGSKAIIPHEFTLSGQTITERLRKEKIKHVWMWSGTGDRKKSLHQFQRDPDTEVLVMNWMVGAYALNLQMAKYMLVYESPTGCIDRDQLERRFWRKGAEGVCTLIDLVMRDSADQRILDFHAEGGNIFGAVYRDPGKLLLMPKAKKAA
jgi:hypothetical protein